MKTVREMFVSLTAMLINHIWASIIEICVEKWRTKSLKKLSLTHTQQLLDVSLPNDISGQRDADLL